MGVTAVLQRTRTDVPGNSRRPKRVLYTGCMTAPVDIGTLIVSTPGIAGGRPRVNGTGISVRTLAALSIRGMSVEEIIREHYPQLSPAQVFACLAYYHANRQAVEADLAAEADAYLEWKAEDGNRLANRESTGN